MWRLNWPLVANMTYCEKSREANRSVYHDKRKFTIALIRKVKVAGNNNNFAIIYSTKKKVADGCKSFDGLIKNVCGRFLIMISNWTDGKKTSRGFQPYRSEVRRTADDKASHRNMWIWPVSPNRNEIIFAINVLKRNKDATFTVSEGSGNPGNFFVSKRKRAPVSSVGIGEVFTCAPLSPIVKIILQPIMDHLKNLIDKKQAIIPWGSFCSFLFVLLYVSSAWKVPPLLLKSSWE